MKLIFNLCAFFFLSQSVVFSQITNDLNSQKNQSIQDYRNYFSKHQYRGKSLDTEKTLKECIALLNDQGHFTDLKNEEDIMMEVDWVKNINTTKQSSAGEFLTEAFNRLWLISESYRSKEIDVKSITPELEKLINGFVFYASLEFKRPDTNGRFHSSCFAIPTAAVNSYFALLDLMDKIDTETYHLRKWPEVRVQLESIFDSRRLSRR